MKEIVKKIKYGARDLIIKTGKIARQATAAVTVQMGDTLVLVTVVGRKQAKEGQDFFPLTVNFQIKAYAAGKIPGGYFKREARPTEEETLVSRLIDRPLRPLFPEGFLNEVQIVATVLSLDPEVSPDILSLIGASAAMSLSGIPFKGPVGAARVGYMNGEYILNPSYIASKKETDMTDLDLVVAGTKSAVLMVESEAKGLSEEVMLGAVMFGHRHMQVVISAIEELVEEAGKPAWDWKAAELHHDFIARIADLAKDKITAAYAEADKLKRQLKVGQLTEEVLAHFEDPADKKIAAGLVHELEGKVVRDRVLAGHPRIDGRDTKTVRPISIETGILPRVHGSALFTRGETQAIVAVTLGTTPDAQMIDDFSGKYDDSFMLHYNFPPYCVGETGMMTGPKRRDIGHGRLAKRGVAGVLPSSKEFPYVLRVVSDITESNGSSSMATVCGASLALMDAGVPIKAPVSGVAMGLVKEGSKFVVLTDILGDEDHLGDMDFKVAGTATGVNALQMDIKIDGITEEIMKVALDQAKVARLHILNEMNQALSSVRSEMSKHAPRLTTIKIPVDKIRDIIGKGGVVIRGMIEEFGVEMNVEDDGTVTIASSDQTKSDAALARIKEITAVPEVGKVYHGKVAKIAEFGAFVTIIPGTDGLVHVSEIAHERVKDVNDFLKEGQMVDVKLLEIDKQGRLKLSIKALLPPV